MMEHAPLSSPALTVALALAAGMLAQALARHAKLPGIVFLLGAGVLLGPDVTGIIHPSTLGSALHLLVGFAVAVILFEGGLGLNMKRLRREARTIRALLTVGALITAVGGAVSAWWFMGWDLRLAALFGSLVIVTGPTVITPLLRRIKVKSRVGTVLEAEGVLIDPIGAILAVVTLQVLISPTSDPFSSGFLDVVLRLGFGVVAGVAGGVILALLLRVRRVVPEGLENVFTLSLVLALYQVSNAILTESGIMSVTMAGLVVGNMRTHVGEDLKYFKEQLTAMFIGMLFVLLAADVRIAEVRQLGVPGLLTLASLMFVVRPINVLVCSMGSDLTRKERFFLAWLSPRGVVSAAIASLFAQEIAAFGIPGGDQLRAMVFLVIGGTVIIQGLTGGLVAGALGVRRPAHLGYAVVGANELGHAVGRILRNHGEEVVFVDNNPDACHVVESDSFRVIYGNPLEERTFLRAQIEDRVACVAVTMSDEINFMVGRRAVMEYSVKTSYVATSRAAAITPKMIQEAHCHMLFGTLRDLELWSMRLRRKTAVIETRRANPEGPPAADPSGKTADSGEEPSGVLLRVAVARKGSVTLVSDASTPAPRKDEVLFVAIFEERREEADAWLERNGWIAEEVQTDALTERA